MQVIQLGKAIQELRLCGRERLPEMDQGVVGKLRRYFVRRHPRRWKLRPLRDLLCRAGSHS